MQSSENVKNEKETLMKTFNLRVEQLDFKYVETCKTVKVLENIMQVLESGEEGFYPELLKCTKECLQKLDPKNKLLRTAVNILNKYDLPSEEWCDLSTDIQEWIETVNRNDEELSSFKNMDLKANEPTIRLTTVNKVQAKTSGTDRIKSLDYDSWDKFDADAELLKFDLEEERLKQENAKKMAVKRRLETVVLNKDVATKAELDRAATQSNEFGNECIKAGDYEDAIYYYNNSITFLPTVKTYNNRALAYLKLKDYNKAVDDCNKVLATEMKNEKALLRKSLALKLSKKYKEAAETLRILIQINPNNSDAQKLCSALRQILEKDETARRSVRLSITEENTSECTASDNK